MAPEVRDWLTAIADEIAAAATAIDRLQDAPFFGDMADPLVRHGLMVALQDLDRLGQTAASLAQATRAVGDLVGTAAEDDALGRLAAAVPLHSLRHRLLERYRQRPGNYADDTV